MKKVTAVEWQFEQLFNSFEKFNNGEYTFSEYLRKNLEIREQAKEMEKEQHKKTWVNGMFCNHGDEIDEFSNYYNGTFKSE